MGNAARDPKVSEFQSGNKKAQITLAVGDRGYTKKDGTKVEPTTTYVDCEVWGNTVGFVQQYVKKGSMLFIEGRIALDAYEDRNNPGKKIYRTYVKADNIQFAGSAPKSDGGNTVSNGNTGNAQATYNQPPAGAGTTVPVEQDGGDSDGLPF